MNINSIEEHIDAVEDTNMKAIIGLIIEAVRFYPKIDLLNVYEFIDEVKKKAEIEEITHEKLIDLINKIELDEEQSIWIVDSLNSLAEAYSLMEINDIKFKNVLLKMELLERAH